MNFFRILIIAFVLCAGVFGEEIVKKSSTNAKSSLESQISQILDEFIAKTCKADDLHNYQATCLQYTSLLKRAFYNRTDKAIVLELNQLDDEFIIEQLSEHFSAIKILVFMYLGDFYGFDWVREFLQYEHNTYCAYFEECDMHLPIIALAAYAAYIHNENLGMIEFNNELKIHKDSGIFLRVYNKIVESSAKNAIDSKPHAKSSKYITQKLAS